MENFATEPIGEFKEITKNYVDWFNNRRISQKTKERVLPGVRRCRSGGARQAHLR
ncbi:hypothetical protein, partial [Lentzea sp. NPDC003310]|uniref:hypothetical protein n=1 Tax=Lentzea sp. NPDC003310 TaxID=3154447 RepID=UPI00339DFC6F